MRAGRWLQPDAFPAVVEGKESGLTLFPRVGHLQELDEGLSHRTRGGSLIVIRASTIALYSPEPLELLLHFLLLPGMALAGAGCVLGLLLALGAALMPRNYRSTEP
jgi:hypothetical protein